MPEPIEIPAEAGYAAATNRALKTTNALILSEALVIQLQEENRKLVRELGIYRQELEETKRQMQRRTATLRRRAELAEEGVMSDATNGEAGGADACREADPAHHFSD